MNQMLSLDAPILEIIEKNFAGLYSGELGLSSIKGGQTAANQVATTFAPVPSFKKFNSLAEIHPYPWLQRPHSGSVKSFSAWRKFK